MTISVVVPVYNSAKSIGQLVEQITCMLDARSESYEIILVNDGSLDNSWTVISVLAKTDPKVRAVNFMRNYGQHNALLCGIRMATYETIVTMDDDLQHPPDQITKLLDALTADYDVVYGTPERVTHQRWRSASSQITKFAVQTATGVDAARNSGAFRAFRTHLRKAFDQYEGPYVNLDVMLTWGSSRFTSVAVRHEPRIIGKSNYSIATLTRLALNMITGYSTAPLTIASLLGLATMLFGISIIVYILIRYCFGGIIVPGFYILLSVICVFAGCQLLCLGILGEYIARIHVRLLSKPSFTVLETLEHEAAERH